MLHIVPAYGRDYRSKAQLLADWAAGKDFRIADMSHPNDGAYVNVSVYPAGPIQARFAQLRKVCVFKATDKPAEAKPAAPAEPNKRKRGELRIREEILRGMARGPWADYWACEREEQGESFSGVDIYDAAPETPEWAEHWAVILCSEIAHANGVSIAALFSIAQKLGFARDAESFGCSLGLQAVGHGVSWADDCPPGSYDAIKIPHREFYER